MNRTDRLYALVEELRATAPRPRSASQLAGRYEVSTRTIERDILALQESGVPIYAQEGRRGGYVVDKTLTLPPLNFTPAEMVAVAVSLAGAGATPFAAAMRSALQKILAAASTAQAAEADRLMDRVRLIGPARPGGSRPLSPNGSGPLSLNGSAPLCPNGSAPLCPNGSAPPSLGGSGPPHPGGAGPGVSGEDSSAVETATPPGSGQLETAVPLAIQDAITARHVLLLRYCDRHEAVSDREVEPVAFAGTQSHWYLLAWCRLRGGARAFRLDRIIAAADTGEPAPGRSYGDLHVNIPDALVRRPELAG